jgi:hypothetical protein
MNTLHNRHPGFRGGLFSHTRTRRIEQTSNSISSATFVAEAQSYLRAG